MATFIMTSSERQLISQTVLGAPAAASGPVQYQDGWRCCQKCSGLFYGLRLQRDPDEGHCAAGGKHDSTNSKDYMVPFGGAGPGMQTGWRYCQRCQGLFYVDHPTQGACPCGGQHDHANRSAFYDMLLEGPPGMDTGWRWCAKCEGLFNSGNNQNVCPTGGKHDASGSSAYAMKLGALPNTSVHTLKPQLFLVETYQLSTFHGGLVLGDNVGTNMIPAVTHTTTRLIINKMKQEEVEQSSTVMDDQTDESTQNFNQRVQDSSDSKSSGEHYDYGMQGSFHGEGQVGFGSASADANVQVAGSTNDVRQEMAQSVGHAIDSQVSQANQLRKQQVTVGQSDTKIDENTQTEVDIEQKNDSDRPLNFGIFQVKEELITILSLVDVQVAFRNTDSNNDKTAKLFELDSLLEDVIAAPKDRPVIKSQIKAVLENVRDYMDESKSILAPDPARPDTLVVNKRLTSAYELKNRDGTTRKVLSVPGIIVSDYSPRFIYQRGAYMTLPLT